LDAIVGLPQVKGCYRDTEEHRSSHIAMRRTQNAGKPAKLEQNKVN
jgi:hypothetical protein